MAKLRIRTYPDPVLKKKALPVKAVDNRVAKLASDMLETMYASAGVGLAAPQVGVSERIIVVDAGSEDGSRNPMVFINPEIIASEGTVESQEGCLSLPEFRTAVKRAARIKVKALNAEGAEFTIEAEGLFARAVQHEIDHLDGITLLERSGLLKRELYKKRLSRQAVA